MTLLVYILEKCPQKVKKRSVFFTFQDKMRNFLAVA